jgi:alpha-glucosidase
VNKKLSTSLNTIVNSPSGDISVSFGLTVRNGKEGCPTYSVSYKGKPLLLDTPLGFRLKDGEDLTCGMLISDIQHSSQDKVWKPLYAERSEIRDNYNETQVMLIQNDKLGHELNLCFRAYNEGVAFSWSFIGANWEKVHIVKEESRFCFTGDHKTWTTYTAQGAYLETVISEVKPGCERPLTIETNDGLYVALAEAKLVDYARTKFDLDPELANCIICNLSGEVESDAPLTTPWRVIMIAESPGQLFESNYLILNLNDPCAIEDTSWIKPGKVIREVSLTTQGGKASIDFAARHNLQYVEFDAGWYGPENDNDSDATFVSVDPKRSDGSLDLHEVIRYGDEKGIGIILYVNRRALERQLDVIFPLYKQWGVKGVKFGFVNVGSQHWTNWLHEAVRKAAEHHLMVDIHDEYRPTGYSRTYPNLLTQEGIRGDEEIQPNENTLTILFTRMLLGAADITVCYFDSRVDLLSSHAYQLAKSVVFYSPWQFLYWYDRPVDSSSTGGGGNEKRIIQEVPELDFYDQLVTTWDDTRVIHGVIGQYATVARRSGDQWFIGSMNGGQARTVKIPLCFLKPGVTYDAYIYSDDRSVATTTNVRIAIRKVNAETVLTSVLPSKGGQAIRLVPLEPID